MGCFLVEHAGAGCRQCIGDEVEGVANVAGGVLAPLVVSDQRIDRRSG